MSSGLVASQLTKVSNMASTVLPSWAAQDQECVIQLGSYAAGGMARSVSSREGRGVPGRGDRVTTGRVESGKLAFWLVSWFRSWDYFWRGSGKA